MTRHLVSQLVGEGGEHKPCTQAEVRGQLAGVGALLPTVFVPETERGLSGLAASTFTC